MKLLCPVLAMAALLSGFSNGAWADTFSYSEDLVTVTGSTFNLAPTSTTGTVETDTVSIPCATRSPFENYSPAGTQGTGYGSPDPSTIKKSALQQFLLLR